MVAETVKMLSMIWVLEKISQRLGNSECCIECRVRDLGFQTNILGQKMKC
jgi:hypothetical protein